MPFGVSMTDGQMFRTVFLTREHEGFLERKFIIFCKLPV